MSFYAKARLREEMDAELVESGYYPYMGRLPEADPSILSAVHRFDKAHVLMLGEEGIIPRKAAAAILTCLREMEELGVEEVRLRTGQGIHSGEDLLRDKLGAEVAGHIHTARASPDIQHCAIRLLARERLLQVMSELNALRETLLNVAEAHQDTLMPGYGRMGHGDPYVFSHYALSWVYPLERHFQRLQALYGRVNISTAGTVAISGSPFPVNRLRTAELLGFADVCTNAKDPGHPDTELEIFATLAIMANTLDRLAMDLSLFHTAEYDMIEVADRYCITSSVRPQKKNPGGLEYIRGQCGLMLGYLMSAFSVYKTPSGAEHSLMIPRSLWPAFQALLSSLRVTNGVMTTLKVNEARMRELTGSHWGQATDLAVAIVREKGMSWRTAHQIVATMVRRADEEGKSVAEVTGGMLDTAAMQVVGKPLSLSESSMRKALDLAECVKGRATIGGTAPEEVLRRLAERRESLARDREVLRGLETKQRIAAEKQEKAVQEFISA